VASNIDPRFRISDHHFRNNLSGPAGQSFCIGIFRADLSLQLGPAEMQISIEAVEAMRKQGVKIKSK